MTDNPMSSAHQKCLRTALKTADKKATVELPGVLALHHLGMLLVADLNHHCRVHENPQSTAR
jgi:hypothetical protein